MNVTLKPEGQPNYIKFPNYKLFGCAINEISIKCRFVYSGQYSVKNTNRGFF